MRTERQYPLTSTARTALVRAGVARQSTITMTQGDSVTRTDGGEGWTRGASSVDGAARRLSPTLVDARLSPAQHARHDSVVRAIVAQSRWHIALTNLSDCHPVHLGGEWLDVSPDILFCDRETFLVAHAVEVELAATVSVGRVPLWARIARAVRDRGTFWLLVPPTALARAVRLCRRYGIAACIGAWSIGPAGVAVRWAGASEQRVPPSKNPAP